MLAIASQAVRRALRRITHSAVIHPRTDEDRNARLLYLNTASIGVASGGLISFLPVFMARLGASSTLVSLLTSAPALLAVFMLMPGAMIAERSNDQVKVRVRYAYLVLVGYLLCALAPWVVPIEWLPVALIFVWALKTFPEAVGIPAWTSVVARAVSPRRRAEMNGIRWALLSMVMAVSSAFFGWLLDQIVFPLNYQIVFFISFASGALDPFFFSKIVVSPLERAPEDTDAATRRRGILAAPRRLVDYWRPVLQHKPFMAFMAATIIYRVALNLPVALYSLYWVNVLKVPDTLIGLRGTVGNAALVIGYIYWGRSANRLTHRKVLFITALGYALYPILTALVPSGIWLLPVAALWGLMAAGIDIGLFDLMLSTWPNKRQPLFAAAWSMAVNGVVFVAPLIGAALANRTTLGTALVVAGAAQMLTTIPFLKLPKDV
jgi:MFS family permease